MIEIEEESWKLVRQVGNYNGYDGKRDIDSFLPELFKSEFCPASEPWNKS